MIRTPRQFVRTQRRGSLVPAIALAILVIGMAMALVLDSLWVDAARNELRTATEASALAAAGQLVQEDRLRHDLDPIALIDDALTAADEAASRNTVAGAPVLLDTEYGGDVRFGKLIWDEDHQQAKFIESDYFPTSVAVRAQRTREIGNPIARLFRANGGDGAADAVVIAEATVNNRVLGFRPYPGAPVPLLPLSILDTATIGQTATAWTDQVEQQAGRDDYRFDPVTRQVCPGADGLHEMTLTMLPKEEDASKQNAVLLDLGNGLQPTALAPQSTDGIESGDLEASSGEMLFASMQQVPATRRLPAEVASALQSLVGQTRICLLHGGLDVVDAEQAKVRITRPVAIRILAVDLSDRPSLTVQPTIVTTRTALVLDPDGTASDLEGAGTPYVFKISLTN